MRHQVLPFRMAHATTDPERARREVEGIRAQVHPRIGAWRRRRRIERAIAIAAALAILAQILQTSGVAGLGAALLSIALVGLALDGLRRASR